MVNSLNFESDYPEGEKIRKNIKKLYYYVKLSNTGVPKRIQFKKKMFFVFASFSASYRIVIEPNSNQEISVSEGFKMFPESPEEWEARFVNDNMDRVFGNTRIKAINFVKPGKVIVYNDKNFERIFVYYLFKYTTCSQSTFIYNPYAGFYYEVAEPDFATNETNETMINHMDRCFYFIMKSDYNVTVNLSQIDASYDKLYLTNAIESTLSYYYTYNGVFNLTMNGAWIFKWSTDYSQPYGLVKIQFNTSEETYNFSKLNNNNILDAYYFSEKNKTSSADYRKPRPTLDPNADIVSDTEDILITVVACMWLICFVLLVLLSIPCICFNECFTLKFDKDFDEVRGHIQCRDRVV